MRKIVSIIASVAMCFSLAACSLKMPWEKEQAGKGDEVAKDIETKALDDYTWGELAAISSQIATAKDDDEAQEIAQKYGICDEYGQIKDQIKRFKLSTDFVCEVRVADIRHDDKADGSGKAGISFICAEAATLHSYNDEETIEGGWDKSQIRTYLNNDLKKQMPDDLQGLIAPVSKATNNKGSSADASDVTATTDDIWLLSAHEVLGDINWFGDEYHDYAGPRYDGALNAEGIQYKWFSQNGVTYKGLNDALKRSFKGKPCAWWYRSPLPAPDFSDDPINVFCVFDTGYSQGMAHPSAKNGVLFGFCL